MARRRSRYTANAVDPDPIILLWLLRILVPLGGHREFVRSHGFNNDTLAEVIGLGHWIDPSPKDFDLKAVQSELRLLHQKAEKQWAKTSLPTCLRNNVGQLSDLVSLSATDCRILEFAVSIHNERLLDDTADWLGQISSVKVFHALSTILNLPEPEIRAYLSAQGILARSGLVSVDRTVRPIGRTTTPLSRAGASGSTRISSGKVPRAASWAGLKPSMTQPFSFACPSSACSDWPCGRRWASSRVS